MRSGKTLRPRLAWTAGAAAAVAAICVNAQAQPFPQNAPCPTNQLAPLGIEPAGVSPHCPTGCLVDFKGYKWWTAFQYVGANYNNSYYYNGGLKTIFAPEHVFLGNDGLHLRVNNDIDLGGGKVWSGAEAVLMFRGDNDEANLGYGDYLITAKLLTASAWDALDPNVAVGVFTYERYGAFPTSPRGTSANPWREIDLAEISRWGWNHMGSCPFSGTSGQFDQSTLCRGNAQFAIQDFTQASDSVQRYDIGAVDTITLVMRWRKGGQPATFERYAGAYTLDTLPPPVDVPWNPGQTPSAKNLKTQTAANLNEFIPQAGDASPPACERFHVNFWMGNFRQTSNGLNPPPGSRQEIVITNFEFRPVSLFRLPLPFPLPRF
jgi:hypothetical protein